MNIEEFREYCLSFRGVCDKMPFGRATSEYDRNLLVFCVLDKWFCLVNIDVFDFCIIKGAPDEIGELQARYDDIRPAYHMNKRHWMNVGFNRGVPDDVIRSLVKRSYETVVSSLTKKEREKLQTL